MIAAARHDNATALAAFIEERRHRPFQWGANDCCMFASDWAQIATGIDPAEELGLRNLNTPLAAWRAVRAGGGVRALAARACAAFAWPAVELPYARRGDWVVANSGRHGDALGICLGHLSAFVAPSGLVFIPTRQARQAWRIC